MLEEDQKILEGTPMFRGIGAQELAPLLACLGAEVRRYGKGQFIYQAGDRVERIGIMMSGKACILREDFDGSRHIVTEALAGEVFAEAFACTADVRIPYYVCAVEKSRVMFIDYRKVVSVCPSQCAFHGRMIENMVAVLAGKNIQLTRKLEHVTRRTTRDKLLSYLEDQARQRGGREFEIPFDRQQLADYLGVERSAMSHELGKMRREGVLDFEKSRFHLP